MERVPGLHNYWKDIEQRVATYKLIYDSSGLCGAPAASSTTKVKTDNFL